MNITYENAGTSDIEPIYALCRGLILDYEDLGSIDLDRVLKWVRRKLEDSIGEYTLIRIDGEKAGYYHFFTNADGEYELDDLYIFPEYRNQGIGTAVVQRCCAAVDRPVTLYVFVRNERAVALYRRLGFEITRDLGSRYIMSRGE